MSEFNVVVLASCGGGNFEKLVRNQKEYEFNVTKLICDRVCGAVDKAAKYNIPYEVIEKKLFKDDFFQILDSKIPSKTDLIVLAGFMPILDKTFCKKWKNKIINTHPSLLPKYGGKGMYGVKVQEAVMANKEQFAGCTVHYVTEEIDKGEIIFQKKIEVDYQQTPWELGGRVFNEEGVLLLKAIEKIKKTPMVSICCITYNQVNYIRKCLDSFLMQKTNFRYEVLIHDDASTDGTEEIIREYAAKYPDIIKPLYETENQYSKGVAISKTYNFPRVQGKYMAFCEGDDYWIDENKLQKQVDFMKANPDYTICFHPVKRVFETKIRENDTFPTADMIDAGFTFENLLKYNFIQTNSVMYRWEAVRDVANNFPANILPGDRYLHLMFAQKGKIKFLEDIMSVYRINSRGVWYNSFENKGELYNKYCFKMMNFYFSVYNNLTDKTEKDYINLVFKNYKSILRNLVINNCKYKAFLFGMKNIAIPVNVFRIYKNILGKVG